MKHTLVPFGNPGVTIDWEVFIDRTENYIDIRFVALCEHPERIQSTPKRYGFERTTGLWETTCFELFFGVPGEERYWEANLSPSGEWNLFRFDRYRENRQEEQAVTLIGSDFFRGADRLRLDVTLDLVWLNIHHQPIELSATSVIQESTGELSYWAVHHAGPEPDFHLRESFVVELPEITIYPSDLV
jgi:hypothetical protein